jgi:hypothetical protein
VAPYASGALAWAPLAVTVSAVTVYLYQMTEAVPDHQRQSEFAAGVMENLGAFALAVAGSVGTLWLWSTLALLKRATGCGWGRIAAAAVLLPPTWLGLILLTPLLLAVIGAFVVLVSLSVR